MEQDLAEKKEAFTMRGGMAERTLSEGSASLSSKPLVQVCFGQVTAVVARLGIGPYDCPEVRIQRVSLRRTLMWIHQHPGDFWRESLFQVQIQSLFMDAFVCF